MPDGTHTLILDHAAAAAFNMPELVSPTPPAPAPLSGALTAAIDAIYAFLPVVIAKGKAHTQAEEYARDCSVDEQERADDAEAVAYAAWGEALDQRTDLIKAMLAVPAATAQEALHKIEVARSVIGGDLFGDFAMLEDVQLVLKAAMADMERFANPLAALRPAWNAAVAAMYQAEAAAVSLKTDESLDREVDTEDAVLRAAAPDAAAVALKVRRLINQLCLTTIGEDADNPHDFEKCLNEGDWGVSVTAEIYRDLLRLAGVDSPLFSVERKHG